MTSVFLVHHIEEIQSDGFQGKKLIGIFSTVKEARLAIRRLFDAPGFRSYPERWQIDEVTLDQDDWLQGFDPATHERLS